MALAPWILRVFYTREFLGAVSKSSPKQKSPWPRRIALLAALADGQSLQQAATELYLSPRTAQRRLSSARATLGVRTTREAVLAWTRLNRDQPS